MKMKVHVVHDQHGRILGAAEIGPGGGDRPVARPGLTVAELDVPHEFEGKKPGDFMHLIHVDVAGRRLVRSR
jgi:hypothetical protein